MREGINEQSKLLMSVWWLQKDKPVKQRNYEDSKNTKIDK